MNRYARSVEELIFTFALTATLAAACAEPREYDQAASASRAELEHGRYLVDSVLLCTNCHSRRDWSLYSGPVESASEWLGGSVDVFRNGSRAPAVSAASLEEWTVDELATTLTTGRTPAGERIHDRWLLGNLEDLTSDDARSVAAYLKSGPDLTVEPRSRGSQSGPERGAYLVSVGRCVLCHGEDLGGGRAVAVPEGASSPSANISIHESAGIGRMSRSEFIDYFKSLSGPDLARVPVPEGTPNTAMPWPQLSGMTREDLGAIYDYIATLPPVERVIAHP